MTKFLVIADGAGEDDFDFNVIEVDALDHKHAVDLVTAPGQGYGKKLAFAVATTQVKVFQLRQRLVAEVTEIDRVASPQGIHRMEHGT